jgi:hypothetical protein
LRVILFPLRFSNCFEFLQYGCWFAGGGWLIELIGCGLLWVIGLIVGNWVGVLLYKTGSEQQNKGTQVNKKGLHPTLCV